MRTAATAISDYLAANAACWHAELYTITPKNPTYATWPRVPLRYTSHEQTIKLNEYGAYLVTESGAELRAYDPIAGHMDEEEYYFTPGALVEEYYGTLIYAPAISRGRIRQSAGLAIDTLDLTIEGACLYDDTVRDYHIQTFSHHALEGLFDDAEVRIDRIVGAYPGDLSLGIIDNYWTGVVGEVSPASLGVKLSCRGGLVRAQACVLPSIRLQASCNLALYSSACAVARATYAQDCVIDSASTTSIVVDTPTLTTELDYYAGGTILWRERHTYPPPTYDGCPAAGRVTPIKAVGGSDGQTLVFASAIPAADVPSAGMHCTLLPGCDKTHATCETRYNNLIHYRGYPHVPQTGAGGR